MSHLFVTILQLHNSPADCARMLIKPLKHVASLLDRNEKNCKVLDFSFFVGVTISGIALCFTGQSYVALDTNC